MKSTITRSDDGTIKLDIIVPWADVEKVREKTLDSLASQVEISGFRKGAAPRRLVTEKLGKERVNEETLKKLIPQAYVEQVREHKLNPIVHPRVHIEAFEEGTDVTFSAEICEEAEVNLKNYKEEVKKVTAKSKIIVPGKNEEENKVSLEEIVNVILARAEVKMSNILVDQEANRLLSQMLDELKTLGLTLDQYLSTRNKTAEQLRAEYEQKAKQDLKLEFILRKIAEQEKITVGEKDINDAISAVKDEKQRAELVKNPYVVASIIRQQKTLDFLTKI